MKFVIFSQSGNHKLLIISKTGLVRELNPGPRAPEARIIPLDQRALVGATYEANQDRYGASLAQW